MKTFTNDNSQAMADAIHAIFGRQAMFVEGLLFHCADATSSDYRGGSWAFVTNDEGTLGFWHPVDQPAYSVACQNYYENPAMGAKSFGAACTLLGLNQLVWRMHEAGETTITQQLTELYHATRHWIFDLAEDPANGLDFSSIYGFID